MQCPHCFKDDLDDRANRCPHCTGRIRKTSLLGGAKKALGGAKRKIHKNVISPAERLERKTRKIGIALVYVPLVCVCMIVFFLHRFSPELTKSILSEEGIALLPVLIFVGFVMMLWDWFSSEL